MKATMIACCTALLLVGCGAAKAQGSRVLSPLGGDADNRMIAEVQAHNPGNLCSLVEKSGKALLMSFGQQAVVDVDGAPAVLSYRAEAGGDRASFTGPAIRISGALARQAVTDVGKTVSHNAAVEIVAGHRSEHLQANWTCQAGLITVHTVH